MIAPDTSRDGTFSKQDLDQLRDLANLYLEAKSLILYAEEVDPSSRANLQIVKELRDAFDHMMRVVVARLGDEPPATVVDDPEYGRKNIQKAVGHVYRAAFDALDGTVISLRKKIHDTLTPYPPSIIKDVIPDYWTLKGTLEKLSEQVANHRERKDVGANIGAILDQYVTDVEMVKELYHTINKFGPALDDRYQAYKKEEKSKTKKDLKRSIIIATVFLILGILLREFLF